MSLTTRQAVNDKTCAHSLISNYACMHVKPFCRYKFNMLSGNHASKNLHFTMYNIAEDYTLLIVTVSISYHVSQCSVKFKNRVYMVEL